MAGEFSIQRPATGLPDLLGMKATGLSPVDLAPMLSATIDITDLYTARRMLYASVSGNPNLTTINSISRGPQVPFGEMWQVWNIGVETAALGAGISFRLQMLMLLTNNGGNFIHIGQPETYTTGQKVRMGYQFTRPMILGPGDDISVVPIDSIGSPNVNPTIYCAYVPIKV